MPDNINVNKELFNEALKAAYEAPVQSESPAVETKAETKPETQAAEQAPAKAEVELDPRLKSLLEQDAERTRALATANEIIARLTKPEDKPAPVKSPRPTKSWGARLKELDPNIDLGRIAEELWHEYTNYEKAPAEIKARKDVYDAYSATEELRNELAEQLNEVRHAQELMLRKGFAGDVAAQLRNLPADKYPSLAKFSGAEFDKAVELAMNLADKSFASEQKAMSASQAIEASEKYLTELLGVLKPFLAVATEAKQEASQVPQSLFPKHSTNQPPPQVEDKEDVNYLRRKALEAAGFPAEKATLFWRGKGY